MTALADQMKVAGLSIGVFEAEPAFTEIDLARDARVHHPLQRAIHGGAADPLILVTNQVNEIIGAQVTFLPQEHVDDLFPLARALTALRLQLCEIGKDAQGKSGRKLEVRSQKSKVKGKGQ
jgi:hypothetical protein